MHTQISPVILTTPSGHPFRASHVVSAQRGKSPDLLRIMLDGGEVLADRWPSEAEASAFLTAVHLGMRGIESTSGERDNAPIELPKWATRANAEVVSREVDSVGGSRSRMAEAYARTLLGIGEPASIINAGTIETCFRAALSDGKVLVLAGMDDPSHARTLDPILQHSPLVRLALATVEVLIRSGKSPADAVKALEFAADTANGGEVACLVTMGEAGLTDVLRSIALPRLSFYHCALNGVLFAEWVGWHGNPLVVRNVQEAPIAGLYDAARPEHRAVVARIAEHFEAIGCDYGAAADRMRDNQDYAMTRIVGRVMDCE